MHIRKAAWSRSTQSGFTTGFFTRLLLGKGYWSNSLLPTCSSEIEHEAIFRSGFCSQNLPSAAKVSVNDAPVASLAWEACLPIRIGPHELPSHSSRHPPPLVAAIAAHLRSDRQQVLNTREEQRIRRRGRRTQSMSSLTSSDRFTGCDLIGCGFAAITASRICISSSCSQRHRVISFRVRSPMAMRYLQDREGVARRQS